MSYACVAGNGCQATALGSMAGSRQQWGSARDSMATGRQRRDLHRVGPAGQDVRQWLDCLSGRHRALIVPCPVSRIQPAAQTGDHRNEAEHHLRLAQPAHYSTSSHCGFSARVCPNSLITAERRQPRSHLRRVGEDAQLMCQGSWLIDARPPLAVNHKTIRHAAGGSSRRAHAWLHDQKVLPAHLPAHLCGWHLANVYGRAACGRSECVVATAHGFDAAAHVVHCGCNALQTTPS